jgi:RimJ/RimL family protein N-acetyltransferase
MQRLQWLEQLDPPVEREALVLHRRSNTPLGFLALSAIDFHNAKAEVSVAFFQGQGCRAALEAVHWLLDAAFIRFSFEKLVFCVSPDNFTAIQFLVALGIVREAVLREELRAADGQRADLWRYALLRPEWLDSPARARLQRLVPLQPLSATET